MTPELWNDDDPVDVVQRHSRYVQAADRIEAVEKIISEYHDALKRREHGGVAQDKAIKAIEQLYDMPYDA